MKNLENDINSDEDMLPEYNLDYSKSRPNKYAKQNSVLIPIDEDVADVFQTPENINKVLKAIISAFPKNKIAVLQFNP